MPVPLALRFLAIFSIAALYPLATSAGEKTRGAGDHLPTVAVVDANALGESRPDDEDDALVDAVVDAAAASDAKEDSQKDGHQ